jgi:hypothetical protein
MISLLARTKGSHRSVEGNCVQIVRSAFLAFQVNSYSCCECGLTVWGFSNVRNIFEGIQNLCLQGI